MRLVGRVRIGPYGGVSKSARRHQAFFETEDGRRLRLRRRGGNAMRDPTLEALNGARVEVEGDLHDGLLLASSVERIEENDTGGA